MSIYNKANLVQIPSGYNGSTAKLYSVLPANGDGDFTVSADADATRIDENGLIESTVANQARLSRNFIDGVVQPDPFLLLEPTRTNLLSRSEEFNLWGDTGVTVTTNATIAPTGAQTADLLTSSANNWRRSQAVTVANGSVYSFSCFVKKHTTTDKIRFELYKGSNASNLDFVFSTETLSASDASLTDLKVENYPNDWYRVSCKFTANGTNAIVYAYPSQGYSSSGSAYFWGAQLEAGSYPTSYIPTTTAAVTRTADLCTNGGNSSLFNTNQGVLFAHLEGLADAAESNRYISLSNGSPSSSIMIQYRNSGELRLYNNGTGGSSLIFADYSADLTDIKKIAIQYGENTSDYKVYINGVSKTINTGFSATSISSLDEIDFDYPLGTLGFFGKIYQVMYFDTALTDSELQTLTSYDSFGQMAKALLYTIE